MDAKFDKALSLAYFYLKFRARTRAEIVAYLRKKGARFHFNDETIDAVIAKLTEEGHINDRKFVGMYVHDRTSFKPRSEFLLRRELAKLGVPKEYTDEYFQKNAVDETSLARDLLERRKRSFDRSHGKDRFKKAVSFLMRKGFSYDMSKKAFNSVYGEDTEKEKAFED